MSFHKRPLSSPETNLPVSKISNLNESTDSEVSFSVSGSNSFVSALDSDSESFHLENTLAPMMANFNGDFAIGTSPDIVDLICTMVFEINGQPYLSPSLSDDDAFLMLRQVA